MVMYLSTHFFKYFCLFSIFLLCCYIFTIFDIFRYIFCLFRKEKGKGCAAAGESVTSHAIRKDSLWESLRMTAVAVTIQKNTPFVE